MQFEEAGSFIINKLKNGLPGQLSYHNTDHALDVYHAAELIGHEEHVTDEEMKLLLTAAWYHDAGFLIRAKGHELESCKMVNEILPAYGYSEKQIEVICGLIMATRLPQTPKTHLEQILADADLDYLGRDDFFEIGEQLFKESYFNGIINNEDEWDQKQVKFIENHHYFTKTSVSLREAAKIRNLQKVKARINAAIK
jgi:uncharacterized protein